MSHHKHVKLDLSSLQVRDQFKARVFFPQKGSDDDPETITVIGKKENAEAARDHILKLIKDLVWAVHCQLTKKGGRGRRGRS